MSTYSPSLRVELLNTGTNAGTWGNTANDNFSTVFDAAIAGYITVTVVSANQALTYVNGPTATAAANESVRAALNLTTSTSADFAVYAPPVSKLYVIKNSSSYTATVYNSTVIGNTTAAGTGVAIPAGKTMAVWSDGTNFTQQTNHLISPTLASPTMTGTPVAPTAAPGTNTTQVATTAFTAAAITAATGSLGTMSTQNANNVNITGGSISGITDLAVADGGTGASTASGARTNLGLVIGTDVPSPTGGGASGTWNISISGNAATATNATNATNANYANSAGVANNAVGYNQTWQDVTGSRANGGTYTNSTGRPITVLVSGQCTYATAYVNGVLVVNVSNPPNFFPFSVTLVVPSGATYQFNFTSIQSWAELR